MAYVYAELILARVLAKQCFGFFFFFRSSDAEMRHTEMCSDFIGRQQIARTFHCMCLNAKLKAIAEYFIQTFFFTPGVIN